MRSFIALIALLVLTSGTAFANVCEGDVCPLPVAGEKPAVITTAELEKLVQSGEVILIETRPGIKVGLPGARLLNGTPTAEQASAVIPSKDSPVVTYCANVNCFSSENMAKHLKSLGYTNVREYPQGIAGWRRAGHPVEPIR